jgi:predicted DsbA family dithiol-disulfide isomerase
MDDPITLDIISDTICPWCFIGKRRLEAALEMRPDLEIDIRWRAYQLNPDMPKEGMSRRAYLERKFGPDGAEGVYQRISEAGRQAGLAFALERIERTPNTTDSHRLIRWAGTAGVQNEVIEALFTAYFMEGRDISDPTVLTEIAAAAGMDGERTRELLESDSDVELIREEVRLASEMGVTGVPCFIFDNRFAVMGAQAPETLAGALDRVRSEAAAAG